MVERLIWFELGQKLVSDIPQENGVLMMENLCMSLFGVARANLLLSNAVGPLVMNSGKMCGRLDKVTENPVFGIEVPTSANSE